MPVLFCTDWDNADLDQMVGENIVMPDGSRHYIEMSMVHWYALEFMMRRGHTTQSIAEDMNRIIREHDGGPEDFDDLFRTAVFSYLSARVESEQKRKLKRPR